LAVQAGVSQGHLSMMSLTEPPKTATYVDSSVALYRGLKVAVYLVDKTELQLTRNDLVELVNVRINNILISVAYSVHSSRKISSGVVV